MTVRRVKLRDRGAAEADGITFTSAILPKWARRTRSLDALLPVLYLRGNDKAKGYLLRLQKRMSKAKALSALAHKVGRCVYYMLKNKKVFDEKRFLAS